MTTDMEEKTKDGEIIDQKMEVQQAGSTRRKVEKSRIVENRRTKEKVVENPNVDLKIGQQFGRLTIIEKCQSPIKTAQKYLCRCSCGNYLVVQRCYLVRGRVGSCGCTHPQRLTVAQKYHRHGHSKGRMYQRWLRLRRSEYPLCKDWENFLNFENWANNNGYTADKFLYVDFGDMPENERTYSPESCAWIDKSERHEKALERKHQVRLGCSRRYAESIRQKQRQHRPYEKLKNTQYSYKGFISHTIAEWAEILNLPYITVSKRIANTYSGTLEEAFATPYKGQDLLPVLDRYVAQMRRGSRASQINMAGKK